MTKNRIEDFAFIMQRRLSRRFPEIHLSDLELADDILLLENDMQRAQSQLSGLEPSAKTANLKIGIPSTKVLTLKTNPTTPIQLQGKPLELVVDFKYLGANIRSSSLKSGKGKRGEPFGNLKNCGLLMPCHCH